MSLETETFPRAKLLPSASRALPRVRGNTPSTTQRFTVDGSRELETHLAKTCEKIAAGVRGLIPARRLEAILLGGGYGRGEGGVLRTRDGDRPYNDLEFYVCVAGNRHINEQRFGRALHVLGEILTPQAGVDVEFRITSLPELERSAVTMFSYDLVTRHRWLIGSEELLARCLHHREAASIPLHEATRLLMNRGSGLLFAKERLEKLNFTPADADFARRNIAKAELALGDALLVARGQYHWSARERGIRVEQLEPEDAMPWLADVSRHHAAGVEFKLHPERSRATRDELRARHALVATLTGRVWLWIEARRLRTHFASARDYALSPRDKCPASPRARNILVNLKAVGVRPLLQERASQHPRERILHALALLLWDSEALTNVTLRKRVQRELQTEATSFAEVMRAYRALWAKVN
jgi:hypothetical protein